MSPQTRPPLVVERLLALTIGETERTAILGDFAEEYAVVAASRGRWAAVRWYCGQAIRSAGPNLARRFRSPQPFQVLPSRSSRMSSLLQDLTFALRLLRRRPALAIVAGLSMAAGISLTAVVFSLLDAAVLRPLPVSNPHELAVVLSRRDPDFNHNFSYPDFTSYRSGQRVFADLVATGSAAATVRTLGGAKTIQAELVSGTYFQMLGIGARAGRMLTDADVVPEASPVAVVTESLWRDIAGADTPFDGRAAIVNGQAFSVVGIVQPGFHGVQIGGDVRLWSPITQQPAIDPNGGRVYWNRAGTSWLTALARLKPGTTLDQGAADLNRVEAGLGQRPSLAPGEHRVMVLKPGSQGDSFLPGLTAEPLQLLFFAGLLVAVIATANVANLLAARAADRQRELAVRMALGAGRGRLIRLLLIEAGVIGVLSSVLGLIVASSFTGLVVPLLPSFMPLTLDVGLGWRIAGFVTLLGLAMTVLASLVPMVRVWRGRTNQVLADAGRTASAVGAQRLRRALIVAQFALSLGLVVSAALLTRTLLNVRGINTGLALDRVVLLQVDPESAGYDAPRVRQYIDTALAKLSAVPGVAATGYGRVIPLGFGGSRGSIEIPGYTPKPDEDMEINYNAVSPGYFSALGIELVRGRLPGSEDVPESPAVAVVNETMARRYWPDGAAIGRVFKRPGANGPTFEVIGIAKDVKYRFIREETAPSFYTAANQAQNPRGGVMHVRTLGSPAGLMPTLRRVLTEVDLNVPVTTVRTLREQRDRNTADEELAVTIGAVLGGIALALAAVGLFAAMSSSVAGRTREIGVRLALGAKPGEILGLVLRDSLRLVVIGAAAGLTLAYWLVGFVQQRLYGVTAHDPASFILSVVVLATVALAAAWAPARRAAGVDPIQALRIE